MNDCIHYITGQITTWLLVCTGCLSVVTALLGYTAIAYESRVLLALVRSLIIIFIPTSSSSYSYCSTQYCQSSSSSLSQSLASSPMFIRNRQMRTWRTASRTPSSSTTPWTMTAQRLWIRFNHRYHSNKGSLFHQS